MRSLFTAEMKNVRLQRWAIMLEEYGCQIEYKKGSQNIPADMLSRIIPGEPSKCTAAVDVLDNLPTWKTRQTTDDEDKAEDNMPHTDTGPEKCSNTDEGLQEHLMTQIKKEQMLDPYLKELSDVFDDPKAQDPTDYVMEDGVLYHVSMPVRNDPQPRLQLVIPSNLVEGVLEQVHDAEFGGGHLGLDKTYDKLRSRYYWNNMYRDVVNYLDHCPVCKARKLKKARMPMQDMPVPEFPFEIVGIDTCGPFPETAEGNRYVITIVDHFSSWPEAFATRDKSADTVASILLEQFIPRHACPRMMLSDRGTEFVNGVISLLMAKLKVCHIKTSPYHPQTNGKTERFHRFMNDVLSKYVQQEQYTWDQYIPGMLMAYCTSVNESTRYTPFFICHGRDPVLPMDTLLNPKLKYMGEDYVPCMLQRLHRAYSDVKEHMLEARAKNRRLLDKRVKNQSLEPGDAVFYYTPVTAPEASSKLTLHWKPYYRVVEKLSPVLYKIRDQISGKTKIVHAENLQPAHVEEHWDKERNVLENLEPERKTVKEQKVPARIQPPRAAKLAHQFGRRSSYRESLIFPPEESELDWADDMSVDEPVPVGNLQVQDSSRPVPRKRRRTSFVENTDRENQCVPDLVGQPSGYADNPALGPVEPKRFKADIAAVELMQLVKLLCKLV